MTDVNLNTGDMLNSKDLSPTEYKEKLVYLLRPILASVFADDPVKQRIKVRSKRINFACPYCGDSMQNRNAKRGNIILSGKFINKYKCFNCGEFHSLEKFFSDFKSPVDLDIASYIEKTNVEFETYVSQKYDMSFLLDREQVEKHALTREELKAKLGLDEVEKYSTWGWLRNRLQFQKEKYLYHPKKNYLLILNLTHSGKIIGFQQRLFTSGKNNYRTYKLSELYTSFRPGQSVPDEIDSISTIFGIMQLNFARPITLFEGPFDSFLFKNSVAISGASKAFPIDMPLRYWFDDDVTGREKALEYIEQGQTVFLWEKFRRAHEIPWRKKWDLNDLLLYLKENGIRTPNFEPYFSNDPLDIIDL